MVHVTVSHELLQVVKTKYGTSFVLQIFSETEISVEWFVFETWHMFCINLMEKFANAMESGVIVIIF